MARPGDVGNARKTTTSATIAWRGRSHCPEGYLRLRNELVDRSPIVGSVPVRRAVQVAVRVDDKAAVGETCIGLAFESIERAIVPGSVLRLRELEDDSLAVRAAGGGDAVEISGGVEDHASR